MKLSCGLEMQPEGLQGLVFQGRNAVWGKFDESVAFDLWISNADPVFFFVDMDRPAIGIESLSNTWNEWLFGTYFEACLFDVFRFAVCFFLFSQWAKATDMHELTCMREPDFQVIDEKAVISGSIWLNVDRAVLVAERE